MQTNPKQPADLRSANHWDALNNRDGSFRDQRWLAAHNAWNTKDPFYTNQVKSITQLLNYGVRGLALDIYGDNEAKLHLQHGHANLESWKDWNVIRDEIGAWLEKNPTEIVSLFFESYLNRGDALDGLENSLKAISCYKPGRGPQGSAAQSMTLNRLVDANQRLFAFLETEPDKKNGQLSNQSQFPLMTDVFAENLYGDNSLKVPHWVDLRDGSRKQSNRVTFMNHFGNNASGSEWDRNQPSLIKTHAEDFVFAFDGRYPNFISLDYINWDDSNKGPIEAIKALVQRQDVRVKAFSQWSTVYGFDEVHTDFANEPVTGFSVETKRGLGIVNIKAERGGSAAVNQVEVINQPGYGIVNMRYQVLGSPMSKWLTEFETANDVAPKDRWYFQITSPCLGIAVRKSSRYGVVDFSMAY